jgi:hypothetical protein
VIFIKNAKIRSYGGKSLSFDKNTCVDENPVLNNKMKELVDWYEINKKLNVSSTYDEAKQYITVAEILNIVDAKIISVKCTVLCINDSSYDACVKKCCNNTKIINKDCKFFCNKCETFNPEYKVVKKINV